MGVFTKLRVRVHPTDEGAVIPIVLSPAAEAAIEDEELLTSKINSMLKSVLPPSVYCDGGCVLSDEGGVLLPKHHISRYFEDTHRPLHDVFARAPPKDPSWKIFSGLYSSAGKGAPRGISQLFTDTFVGIEHASRFCVHRRAYIFFLAILLATFSSLRAQTFSSLKANVDEVQLLSAAQIGTNSTQMFADVGGADVGGTLVDKKNVSETGNDVLDHQPQARLNMPSIKRNAFAGTSTISRRLDGQGATEVSHELNTSSLDLVVSVYDESPVAVLGHLEECCSPLTCRVFIYSSASQDSTRLGRAYRKGDPSNHGVPLQDWLKSRTKFPLQVESVNNSWTGTEATAYATHIAKHYDDLAVNLAFVQGHLTSWHSDRMCSIIIAGIKKIPHGNVAKAEQDELKNTVYINLNKPYPRRCLSPTGISGPVTSDALRDKFFANWTRWTGAANPRRISYECCAQFATTARSIRARPKEFWINTLRSMELEGDVGWEYLWPTMIDEDGTFKQSRGLC